MSTTITASESSEIAHDAVLAARIAGLRYTGDNKPGIRRKRAGKSFRYLGADGRAVRDPDVLARIKSLAIPPAWKDVWICPQANGHLQATGRDERGRKQYRYHTRWREVRDGAKYERTMAFGRALPKIRKQVHHDLSLSGLPRQKVLAAIVQLLERSLIRVGNEEYAKTNKSFGLTTMRRRHVSVEGSSIHFEFRGKSGIRHEIDIQDRRLAGIVRRCQDLPGQLLFQYIDEAGELQDVDSADVNDYLREITGDEFTAKDFRTWAGTVLASIALQEFEAFDSQAQANKNILRAIESVAEQLGNTPAVCRKCYVHPAVLDAYLDGSMLDALQCRAKRMMKESIGSLKPEEAAVMALLQNRLAREEVKQTKGKRKKT